MDLVNKKVTHKTFGKGRVVKCSDLYIQIDFPSGNKKFVFPDAFGTYLTLIDQKAANFVEKMAQKKKRRREEERLEELKVLQNKKRLRLLERGRISRGRRTYKINPRSQSAFWCRAQEIESVFEDWHVFSGAIKSGQKKGQPRRLAQINRNSACLLTARDPDVPEKERRILGLFMVDENFNVKRCLDGYIPAHAAHRLRLSEQESKEMLFWNYYVDKRYPHKITWNAGRHRYFDNIWMAQILRDIISLRKVPQEQEPLERFFEYFCQMNRIEKEELPEPEGALRGLKK